MEISIRKITLPDVPVLIEISRETFNDTFAHTCTAIDMQYFLDHTFNGQQLIKELNNAEEHNYFIEVAGKPVGYIRFMEDYTDLPIMKKWKALELKRFYILKEFHGLGVAQNLMDFFLAYAYKNNYQAVWLGVWEDNFRAQKFYEKYGFVNSGHTHDFPIGDTPQTDKWFWKFLE